MVISAPPSTWGLRRAIEAFGFCGLGGFAETAVCLPHLTFPLSSRLDYAQGAGIVLNYHTAYFALAGAWPAACGGDRPLIQGAAGGVGTASPPGRQGHGGENSRPGLQ